MAETNEIQETARAYAAALLEGSEPKHIYRNLLEPMEKGLLTAVMDYAANNQVHAAAVLGINRATLRKKLRRYEMMP